VNPLRKPAVHFVVLGLGFYLAKAVVYPPESSQPEAEVIVIEAARVEELGLDWLVRNGPPLSEHTLDALVHAEVDDRLLVEEARRRGLHRSDPVVQRRLLKNMDFLGDRAGSSAAAKLAEAYRLGMDRSDLVVRRRLVQLLQLEAYGSARVPEPSEAELEAYLAEHADRFMQPTRLRLYHVYFSRDKRGAATEADARAALARIVAKENSANAGDDEGDPFMFPRDLALRSERELAKTFGAEFAERVFELPIGHFSGPVASAYGEHLVFVRERSPELLPPLAAVRKAVFESLLEERGKRALRERLRGLREDYTVRIEGRAAPTPEGG
jgi:hypothetical protein